MNIAGFELDDAAMKAVRKTYDAVVKQHQEKTGLDKETAEWSMLMGTSDGKAKPWEVLMMKQMFGAM